MTLLDRFKAHRDGETVIFSGNFKITLNLLKIGLETTKLIYVYIKQQIHFILY